MEVGVGVGEGGVVASWCYVRYMWVIRVIRVVRVIRV